MGYLVTEIIVLLVAAALIGVVLGWALFGGRKKTDSVADPMTADELKAARKSLADAKSRIADADGRAATMGERVEALEKELAAAKAGGGDERVAALESQLRTRDAEVARLTSTGTSEVSALEVMQLQSRLEEKTTELEATRREFEAFKSTGGDMDSAAIVAGLKAEISELKATLATSSSTEMADEAARAEVARLKDELAQVAAAHSELKADHESDQQALEEQDAAIDKLTRELVAAQQRIAELEGRGAPTPASSTPGQVPMPAGLPPLPPAPSEPEGENEATMAVSLDDLVAAIDQKAPTAVKAAVPPPVSVATNPPPPPAAEDDDEDENESTMAIDLSRLVNQIDTKSDVTAPPPADEDDDDDDEGSTVAFNVTDLKGFVDNSATLQQDRPGLIDTDDLKLIKGIGPVSETRLNDYGITTYAALAAVTDDELQAVADQVKMSVERVKPWVEQARERVAEG